MLPRGGRDWERLCGVGRLGLSEMRPPRGTRAGGEAVLCSEMSWGDSQGALGARIRGGVYVPNFGRRSADAQPLPRCGLPGERRKKGG